LETFSILTIGAALSMRRSPLLAPGGLDQGCELVACEPSPGAPIRYDPVARDGANSRYDRSGLSRWRPRSRRVPVPPGWRARPRCWGAATAAARCRAAGSGRRTWGRGSGCARARGRLFQWWWDLASFGAALNVICEMPVGEGAICHLEAPKLAHQGRMK